MLIVFLILLAAEPGDQTTDLAQQVHAILDAKCNTCHNRDRAKPKGEFGYVMDLSRVAANPEYVVKGKPDDSELFILIDEREMPPKKSKTGPLSADQIEIVKQWILAGAPAPAAGDVPVVSTPSATPSEPEISFMDRLLQWIGKIHPLSVHFPIALIVAAGLAELMLKLLGKQQYKQVVSFCLVLGALGAVAAAGLGWVHAIYAGYSDETLFNHRWLGVATAVCSIACAFLAVRSAQNRRALRWALFITIILVTIAGHHGGLLTYGNNFYSW